MAQSGTIEYETSVGSKKLPQYLIVFCVTMGAFSVGTYQTWAFPDVPLSSQYNVTIDASEQSWISSVVPLGGIFGSMPAGLLADRHGRRKIILLTALPLFFCSVYISLARNIIWIFLARFLAGIACGTATVVIPMYISEIAEDSIRGSLGTIFHLQLMIGVLFTYAVGFIQDPCTIHLLCGVPPALLLISMPLIPESPVWLVMQDRIVDADHVLKRSRGKRYQTDKEIARLKRSCATEGVTPGILGLKNYRKAIRITLGLMVFRQLSGIHTMKTYAMNIFLKNEPNRYLFYTLLVGIMQIVAVCLSATLIEPAGRKVQLFMSASIISICMLFLVGYYNYLNAHCGDPIAKSLPLSLFVICIIGFSVGFGPLAWLMVGELFIHNMRSIANTVTVTFYWILTFLVTKYMEELVRLVGESASFTIFCTIGLMGTAFVANMVPETKGKTVEEVQILLYGGNDRTSNNTIPIP